jgi:hypothetical protein
MRITEAQIDVLAQAFRLALVDSRLEVRVRGYREGGAGELALLVRDRFSSELLLVARDGSTRRPNAAAQIPGQTSIPVEPSPVGPKPR